MRPVETRAAAVERISSLASVVGILLATLGTFAMCGGMTARAQATPGDSSAGSANVPSPDAKQLQAGAQILSDTMGVDFSGYMRRLHYEIQRKWEPLIPKEVQSPEMKKGVVGIRFAILPDGTIGSMKLETTSKDVQLDKAAWYAITSEGKFPPLPSEFHGPQLDLRIGFFYNTPANAPSPQMPAPAPQ